MMCEQLSLFALERKDVPAVSLFDGARHSARPPEAWMRSLVKNGEYVIGIGGHPLVLAPTAMVATEIPKDYLFCHYEIFGRVYFGTFVGKEQ